MSYLEVRAPPALTAWSGLVRQAAPRAVHLERSPDALKRATRGAQVYNEKIHDLLQGGSSNPEASQLDVRPPSAAVSLRAASLCARWLLTARRAQNREMSIAAKVVRCTE